jgi:hypothetical protein
MAVVTVIALLATGYVLTLILGFGIGWYSAWKLAQLEAQDP